jgi:N-carbamoylputrescine amidase
VGAEEHAILYADLDLDEVRASHARRLFLRDRRPDLYGAWI